VALIGVLENLEKREKGPEGILAIRKVLPIAFGLNVIAARESTLILAATKISPTVAIK
jgi:hypothetical protein